MTGHDGEMISLTPHMTASDSHEAVSRTFIGQAHIAGTGPEGKTCRECAFWHGLKKNEKGEPRPRYAWFPHNHSDSPGELKRQLCRRPILNKARRGIPHYALACRLFEENSKPPVAIKAKKSAED